MTFACEKFSQIETLILNVYCEFIIVKREILQMREPIGDDQFWAAKIVGQSCSSRSMTPSYTSKRICVSSGKENNTTDTIELNCPILSF